MNNGSTIPAKILDNLSRHFIINVPAVERVDIVKFFFYIEKSHWFYLDTYCMENNNLTKLNINEFAAQVFKHVKFLSAHLNDLNEIIKRFKMYKNKIPTYGAILLSEGYTHVLLLQTYCSKGLWGFPKGKIDGQETTRQCAIREVYEETGYDVSASLKPDWYIDGEWSNASGSSGYTGLYVIPNVSMETDFVPRIRNEIQSYRWFRLDHFFEASRGFNRKSSLQVTANTFYMKHRLKYFLENKLK